MGFTLTDFLYFGSALPDNVDSGALRIFRKDVLRWGVVAHIVEVVVSGVPPLQLLGAVEDSLSELKAYGGLLQSGVPSGYTAVEYIESTGTQYIDTGIPTQDGIGFDVTFLTNSTIGNSGNYGCILGGRKASGNNDVQITTFGNPAGNIRYGSQTGNNAGIVNNQKLHVSLINRVVTLDDGTTYTVSSYTFKESNNIYLFGLNNNGTLAQTGSGCRIYNAKLYANSNVVADFIPVKRNSDSVLGMYDAVSGKFYTNAGTGTFTAGNEIVPTPSDPMDIYCNNGALKILDKSDWTIFTNPTSLPGQGVLISVDGKWYTTNDRGAGCAIPLTIGKQYTLVIHKKTVALGTTLKFGQSPQETPTSAGIQLTDWYRGEIADGQIISFVAKRPYLVMQFYAGAVEAGMIQEAVEVLEAQGGDYTFVDSITADGTQYIDTGILAGSDIKAEVKYKPTNTSAAYCALGGRDFSSGDNRNAFGIWANVSGRTRFDFQSNSVSSTLGSSTTNWNIAVKDGVKNYFNGTQEESNDTTTFASTRNMYLFGMLSGSSVTGNMVGSIAYCRIWKAGVLVRDFMPAIRNSDNVVGMYDTVSGTFLENQGTGTFVAGTVIGDGEVLKLTPSNDTAGVANLLKIDTYVDTQEILTGLINHQVGIYVFDGTEEWVCSANTYIHQNSCDAWTNLYSQGLYATGSSNAKGFCSHLKLENGNIWLLDTPNVFTFHASGATLNYRQCHFNFAHSVIGTSSSSTRNEVVAAVKSYLAAQYTAGTPVIVVYPLATPQDEVAPVPQTMQVVAGDNVLDIVQAGMSGLEVSATYMKGVSVTITEIENANIGNDVEVVIA